MILTTHHVEETLALGRLLGRLAPAPPATTCIALDGQLGAGKTHLTHGIAEGAAVTDPTLVSSPTYVLLNIYAGPKPLHHLDAYRIASAEDFEAVGFGELLDSGGIVVVEWAEKIADLLPADRLHIEIQHDDEGTEGMTSTRTLELSATGPASAALLESVLREWPRGQSSGGG